MSKRRQLELHLSAWQELRTIMAAFKNLSFIEAQKLRRLLATQQQVISNIEEAAADFLAHYPQTIAGTGEHAPLYVLLGSERGFCGDFNESLLTSFREHSASHAATTRIVAIGRKLHARISDDPRLTASLAGPSIAEEVPAVLLRIVDTLNTLQSQHPVSSLRVLHHEIFDTGTRLRLRRPFEDLRPRDPALPYPPLLTLPPAVFFHALVDHHLYAVLHGMFYSSLAAEQQQRLEHLDGAMQRIDKKLAAGWLRRNTLRQEEITEEITLILQSAGKLRSEMPFASHTLPRPGPL